VGEKARQELNVVLGQLVHLFTFVKVKKDWLDRPEIYREMGIEFPK
jgi:GTPase Era involved in 16S rRNA processing